MSRLKPAMWSLLAPVAVFLTLVALDLCELVPAATRDGPVGGPRFRLTDFDGRADAALDTAVQRNGAVIVAGWAQDHSDPTSGWHIPSKGSDIAVARYTPTGRLDKSFSGDGKVRTDIYGDEDVAAAVAVQRNGRIIVAGYAMTEAGNSDLVLVRYRRNGSLDRSFGGDGIVTTTFDPAVRRDAAHDLALQRNGRIVVVGTGSTLVSGCCVQDDFAISRYLPNGSLDPSFSGDGMQLVDVTGIPVQSANAVAIQRDGRIVAGGAVEGDDLDYALVRLRADGALDPSFSGDGKVVTTFNANDAPDLCQQFGGADVINDMLVQRNGRILAAGVSDQCVGDENFAVARYLRDGRLDPSFSKDGRALVDFRAKTAFPKDAAQGVTQWRGGRILLGGSAQGPDSHDPYPDDDFALAMLHRNGSLDRSFWRDGRRTFDLGSDVDFAYGMARQRGGVVLAGTSLLKPANAWDWAVAWMRIPRSESRRRRTGRHKRAWAGREARPARR